MTTDRKWGERLGERHAVKVARLGSRTGDTAICTMACMWCAPGPPGQRVPPIAVLQDLVFLKCNRPVGKPRPFPLSTAECSQTLVLLHSLPCKYNGFRTFNINSVLELDLRNLLQIHEQDLVCMGKSTTWLLKQNNTVLSYKESLYYSLFLLIGFAFTEPIQINLNINALCWPKHM